MTLVTVVKIMTITKVFLLKRSSRGVRKRVRTSRCHMSDGMPKHVLRVFMRRNSHIGTNSALTVLRTPRITTGLSRTRTTDGTTRTIGSGTSHKIHTRRVRNTCRV